MNWQSGEMVVFANEALAGMERIGVWPDAPAFKFFKTVEFKTETALVARDPVEWLNGLKEEGTLGLKLHFAERSPDDYNKASFANGGGRTIIVVEQRTTCEVWESSINVVSHTEADARPWTAVYLQIAPRGPKQWPKAPVLATARPLLERRLRETLDFTTRAKFGFEEYFQNGLNALAGAGPPPNPAFSVGQDSKLLTPEAKSVLAATGVAWVFWGMGSWIDGLPEEPFRDEYRSVSRNLYQAICEGFCAAVNASSAI